MFKSIISIVVIAFISTFAMAYENEINKMSLSITEQINKLDKKRIAVVDFTDLQGNVTELGRFLAEEIAVATMERNPSFSTIDRTHLKVIMKEHKLSETGIIDPDTARKIGKVAGVDGLITGTLTPFGDSIRITLKVLDTQSAEIISAQRTNIAKTAAIQELLSTEFSPISSFGRSPKPKRKKIDTVSMAEQKSGNGLTVKLKKCTKTSDSAKCDFVVISDKASFKNSLYKKSRIIDNAGNEFAASKVTFGDSIGSSGSLRASKMLPKGIPVKSSAEFKGLTEEAEYLALLELHFYQANVQFRDVEFSN